MVIKWTDFAKGKLKSIFKYYELKASELTAEKLVNGIIDSTNKLSKYPESGQLEHYEIFPKQNCRSVKYKKYKTYYLIEESEVIIINIIDMRQDPKAIVKEMKTIEKDKG